MARLDYDQASAAYVRGRPLPRTAITEWREAVAPYVAPGPILDVGAGTGWFAAAFADWFDRPVIAVEPSCGMRAEGAAARRDPRVRYVAGSAEHFPLRNRAAGTAWLSTVIHHCTDLGCAARELSRVLTPGAHVLIRSAFPGRLDDIALFRFFPAARRTVDSFPSIERTVDAFGRAGFMREDLRTVPQVSASSLTEAAAQARTMRNADSTLRGLSDAEFDANLAALEHTAASTSPAPVVDHLDLLVLRLPSSD